MGSHSWRYNREQDVRKGFAAPIQKFSTAVNWAQVHQYDECLAVHFVRHEQADLLQCGHKGPMVEAERQDVHEKISTKDDLC